MLSEYDIVYVTQKSIKGSALAEYLAQQPINDYQSMQLEFPDEDIMTLFEDDQEDQNIKTWTLLYDKASTSWDIV